MNVLPTYAVRLHMAGNIETAKQWLRRDVWDEGLCVTVEPTTFIYTGGEEAGFVVGLVNYPRFPAEPEVIFKRARRIAEGLMVECGQRTALLVAPDKTEWRQRTPEWERVEAFLTGECLEVGKSTYTEGGGCEVIGYTLFLSEEEASWLAHHLDNIDIGNMVASQGLIVATIASKLNAASLEDLSPVPTEGGERARS